MFWRVGRSLEEVWEVVKCNALLVSLVIVNLVLFFRIEVVSYR